MIQLVVFDLDGTLVDSRRDLADSANLLLEECGCAVQSEEAIGRMVGDGAATLVARAFAASDCPAPPDALPRFLAIYERRLLNFTREYPEISDVLIAAAAGRQLALLTNKPLRSTERILHGLGLARHFRSDLVIGGDGPVPRKPDPAGLLLLCERAGAKPEATLLVGDSVIDWRTARSAGTRICLARYGFGFDGFPVHAFDGTESVIDSPRELLGVL